MYDNKIGKIKKKTKINMTNGLKDDSNKYTNEVKKSIQDLYKKASKVDKKLGKNIEILKREMFKMFGLLSQKRKHWKASPID
jgi:hypothetical protein